MSFYIESLIIGIGLLVFIDFVLIVHQDPNFYGEGSIVKALPSWKGKKSCLSIELYIIYQDL